MKRTIKVFLLTILGAMVFLTGCATSMSTEYERSLRISAGEVAGMLGRPDVIVVDVRDPVSWSKAETRVKGAVREDPREISEWAPDYPKDKTLILYCA